MSLFGTTGVRKVYGTEFTLDLALDLGMALGTYLGEGKILLAQDARTTGRMIADAFAAGVMSTGVDVVRAGTIPTPTLAFMTGVDRYAAGVIVTASHNPPEYTGVKFWRSDGMGYTPEQERRIEDILQRREFKRQTWDRLGKDTQIDHAVSRHMTAILDRCDVGLVASMGFKVVVDPGNGVGTLMTPYLLRKLGCKVLSINGQLDGHFPGRRSEPDEESLADLVTMVRQSGAALGVAHDGDSDRVVFVSETGEVIRGDRIIALLAREMIRDCTSKTVVTTVDSSQVLDDTVSKSGGATIRTPVGDIQVAMKIQESGACFGGEACGVFIFPDFHLGPEPFLAVCRVLELMAESGRTLGELISDIPVYPLSKVKLNCEEHIKGPVMELLERRLPSSVPEIVSVTKVDGLGIVLRNGWALVRPSGTEPVIRITCEAKTSDGLRQILDSVEPIVQSTIVEVASRRRQPL
ncbi:MAG: phosphoglucosamine mutase [Candidatus Thorarchaeota archaeon]